MTFKLAIFSYLLGILSSYGVSHSQLLGKYFGYIAFFINMEIVANCIFDQLGSFEGFVLNNPVFQPIDIIEFSLPVALSMLEITLLQSIWMPQFLFWIISFFGLFCLLASQIFRFLQQLEPFIHSSIFSKAFHNLRIQLRYNQLNQSGLFHYRMFLFMPGQCVFNQQLEI